jgi:hypothetical protein
MRISCFNTGFFRSKSGSISNYYLTIVCFVRIFNFLMLLFGRLIHSIHRAQIVITDAKKESERNKQT